MKAKYGIQDEDVYNFDETGFMMGQITSTMVVTGADRSGKRKKVQPGNRDPGCLFGRLVCPAIYSGKGRLPPRQLVLRQHSPTRLGNQAYLEWMDR